jgi:choline dehydrogenase
VGNEFEERHEAHQPISDYVIVGAGTAGCVLAQHLSADPDTTVTLIEAGDSDSLPAIHDPAAFMSLRGSSVDWAFVSESQTCLDGRQIDLPQGKVLGGSSSINYMLYMRGNPADYDSWEAAGNPGWGWTEMLECFRRSEDSPRGESRFHGAGGPVKVCDQSPTRPTDHPFFLSAADIGLPVLDDFFGHRQEGVSYLQLTAGGNTRQSTAVAYLNPARHRKNLTVITDALTHRVDFDGASATGVTYEREGVLRTLTARKEVIVSAGAIGSPHLLMVSGIGPSAHLKSHGIDVVADSPGVGQNLQDHPAAIMSFAATHAPAEWPGFIGAGAFLQTTSGRDRPGLQLSYVPDLSAQRIDVFVIAVAPRSRGAITLRSGDIRDRPAIDPRYLHDPRDRDVLREGVHVARRLLTHDAFAPPGLMEANPGTGVLDSAQMDDWLNRSVESALHLAGTCAMGTHSKAVVDSKLRVRGVKNLRVIDASVMPTLVNANTNLPVIAIAERAAELIR